MCGIGGILRIVKPGDPEYPAQGDPCSEASGAWLWRGPDPRGHAYSLIDQANDASLKPQAPRPSWLIPESRLDMLDEGIKWRGPDGAGRFRDRIVRPDGTIVEVALVHRRLAIIDIESGAQPMVVTRCPRCAEKGTGNREQGSEKGGASGPSLIPDPRSLIPPLSAIVFNGCIYNHRELRTELEAEGHVFESDHSDTEVILHGWCESGASFWQRLDGMYAFAVWDRAGGRLAGRRDRFGEKPILISMGPDGGDLLIASGINALRTVRRAAGLDSRTHPRGLEHWITRGFHGVLLPDAHAIQCQPGGDLDSAGAGDGPRSSSDPDGESTVSDSAAGSVTHNSSILDGLEAALRDSTRVRLDADVPIGCFLSGGVDSSLIAYYARQHHDRLTTLTVRMPDARYDESLHAELVARRLGTDHITLDCDGESAADDLVRIIRCLGLPFGDSSILPTYWVCRAAREHVKVALTGDGGDELFFGYDRYKAMKHLGWRRFILRLLPDALLDRSDPKSPNDRMARLIIAAKHAGYQDLLAIFPTPDREALIGRTDNDERRRSIHASASAARRHDLDHYLPGDLLRKVDTASMMCGLEVRCPMLAPAVAGLALSIPAHVHMRGGEAKHLLKELARRRLPREVVDRPKQGFAIPISDWWRTNFGGLRDLLLDMLAGERPFGHVHDVLEINMDFVRRILDEHWAAGGLTPIHTKRRVRPRDHGQRLFALVSLAIWAKSVHPGGTENAERRI